MKVSLIVMTAGPNMGRAIAISGTQFLIGRDQECNLRPASPAISKQHCGLFIRDDQVFVRDLGSTNGTLVDGKIIEGEQAILSGALLKVGPLEFRVEILPMRKSDGTPLPQQLNGPAGEKLRAATIDGVQTGRPTPASGQASVPRPTKTMAPVKKPPAAPPPSDSDGDDAAAMLLGLDDPVPGESPEIPDGSTVMDLPQVSDAQLREAEEKKKKKSISGAEMSAAANDILRKYIRRTGN